MRYVAYPGPACKNLAVACTWIRRLLDSPPFAMHEHFRHRQMQAALAVSVLGGIWTFTVLITGGFVVEIGSIRISSRHALNPFVLTVVAAAAAYALATPFERRRVWPARGRVGA